MVFRLLCPLPEVRTIRLPELGLAPSVLQTPLSSCRSLLRVPIGLVEVPPFPSTTLLHLSPSFFRTLSVDG